MPSLGRLRRKITAWYVATFGAILLAFGLGLFFVIRHNIALKLDRSLVRAAGEVERSVGAAGATNTGRVLAIDRLSDLRIPDRALYLFDLHGRELYPDTASVFVRGAVRSAIQDGATSLQVDIGHEHALLVHARRFADPRGDTLIAVASADTIELEDEYTSLIALFSGMLVAALAVVGVGGYLLARRATEPVEQSIAQMRRFIADAAHELRTPVSHVRAHADVALQQPRDAVAYADALREISGEAARLGGIVDDLFTLARADAGERRIQRETFYLDDAVLEVAREARSTATVAGVHIDITNFDETLIDADPTLVRQLLRIVIDNAIKYTPNGGRVRVAAIANEARARVVIEDSGIGIPADALPRIFDRFYRAEPARQHAEGGGLGLAIARWIADAHGAELLVTSDAGCGTRVEISFAVARAKADPAAQRGGVTVA